MCVVWGKERGQDGKKSFTFPPLDLGILKLLKMHIHVELSKVLLCITISSSEQDIQGGYRVGTFITTLRS